MRAFGLILIGLLSFGCSEFPSLAAMPETPPTEAICFDENGAYIGHINTMNEIFFTTGNTENIMVNGTLIHATCFLEKDIKNLSTQESIEKTKTCGMVTVSASYMDMPPIRDDDSGFKLNCEKRGYTYQRTEVGAVCYNASDFSNGITVIR